jgi:hypothetical protein
MSIPEGMIANDVATTALPWLISFSLGFCGVSACR